MRVFILTAGVATAGVAIAGVATSGVGRQTSDLGPFGQLAFESGPQRVQLEEIEV
jgi:hypothetical protein